MSSLVDGLGTMARCSSSAHHARTYQVPLGVDFRPGSAFKDGRRNPTIRRTLRFAEMTGVRTMIKIAAAAEA
jgi:hypothetical protein